MWKLLRSKRGHRFLPTAGFLLSAAGGWALPVDHINVFVGAGTYTAGVSTTATLQIHAFDSSSAAPSAGETVFLELLKDGVVVPGGVSPASFQTDGAIVYVPGSGIPALTFYTEGSNLTLRARPAGGGSSGSDTGTVAAGPAANLVALAPGQTLLPGHDLSVDPRTVVGTVPPQEPDQDFTVTVALTDAYFNPVSGTDTVSLAATPSDLVTISGAGALVAGTKNFTVRLGAPRISRALVPADETPPAAAAVSVAVTAVGPPPEEVFPYPNPFNPHTGTMNFQVGVDQAKSVTVKVVDPFGQAVWERSMDAVIGENRIVWDGRNDNGQTVAAGFYYVLLDIGGSIKSKKKIGVVK